MIDLNGYCRQAKDISDKRLKLGHFGNRKNTTENLLKHCADVITCIAVIAALEKIDLEKALQKCMEKNRKRIAG